MTEHQTWILSPTDKLPPWWWLAQQWHWLWRRDGQLADRENAYYCARMHIFENWIRSSRERA